MKAAVEHKIHVTFFDNQQAQTLIADELSLERLKALILGTRANSKAELPWLKLAIFGDKRTGRNCLRHNANVKQIAGVEMDYDRKKISLEEGIAIATENGLNAIFYTTANYKLKAPKWRMLTPTSKLLTPELRRPLAEHLNQMFGGIFATESLTLSQAFYFGYVGTGKGHRVEIVNGGMCIDELVYIDARGFQAYLAAMGDGAGLKGFRAPLLSATMSYANQHGSDFDQQALKVILREAIEAAPKAPDRDPADIKRYSSERYLDDVIKSAIKKCVERSGLAATINALPWRERRPNAMPLPSMHNARLAIAAIGVECSYNTFHNKMLFGFKGDLQHEIQFLVGEVTDNGIIRLRQILSDRFGFDLGEQATRDAVVSIALEHCFDPVWDMLAKAQADWDGVERLDAMVVNYFNCGDTQLNRAIMRKTMIAAVRRVRDPGCKFDTITVLESLEGWNKSSAWRVLAGDENFSDASILGHGAREVQEQLAEVWIHENADLAGMKKAEVETVKTFASRQSDDARPAYGHFLKKQKRHSIEVGTTNSEEYLQSQTGNRRFWPLRVEKTIDLDLLKRDRLQLWGEAAKYEADQESITLDKKLWPAAAAAQEKRRVKDAWEDILADMPTHCYKDQYGRITHVHFTEEETLKQDEAGDKSVYIKILHRDGDREYVASADILTVVLGVPPGQQHHGHGMRLANAMQRVGWQRTSSKKVQINGARVRGYFRPRAKTATKDVPGRLGPN